MQQQLHVMETHNDSTRTHFYVLYGQKTRTSNLICSLSNLYTWTHAQHHALFGFSHRAAACPLAVDDGNTPSPHQQTLGFCFVLLLANSAVEVLLALCGQWKNPHPDVTFREREGRGQ